MPVPDRPRFRTVGLVAGAVVVLGAGVAWAKDVVKNGTYAGTVTPPSGLASPGGAAPFPMSFTVHSDKVSGLKIGPIQIDCQTHSGDVTEQATLPELSGFPSVKTNGGIFVTFVYANGTWQKAPTGGTQPGVTELALNLAYYNRPKPLKFASTGGAIPGLTLTTDVDVSGTSATIDPQGTASCDLTNANAASPTLKLR